MAAVSLAMPTKLWDSAGRECGRTFLYLRQLLDHAVSNLSFLIHGGCMLPPINRFPTAFLSCAHHRIDCTDRNHVQPYGFLRNYAPFRSLTFLPNVAIESN